MDVLLLLGASVRAAAFSARRASLPTTAIDLFADRDLAAVCPARVIARDRYPGGLASMALGCPAGPWLYTGALENHPDLVDRIAASRPLWGNSGTTLRAVRDPLAVAAVLGGARLPCPLVRSSSEPLPPPDGSWLVKPLASGGGSGIHPLAPGEEPSARCYYQERIDGLSLSAVFVAGHKGAVLAGVTRQLIGRPGARFAYAGSVGPWPVDRILKWRIAALGDSLARGFGLRGLFGVDFILRGGVPWPVEVNPRYTASVEVLELALGSSLLGDHARAFGAESPEPAPATRRGAVGKQIVFAPRACRFAGRLASRAPAVSADPFALPRIADVPAPYSSFEPGDPVLTVFVAAPTVEDCIAILAARAGRYERRLEDA